jgi:hypothetical protein
MEPPVLTTATAGIFMFSLIRHWLTHRLGSRFLRCYAESNVTSDTRVRP